MIHQYKLNGYNIVLDPASGAVHCVDNLAYDAVALFETMEREALADRLTADYAHMPDITRQDVLDTLDDIQELKRAGKLFSEDRFAALAPTLKNKHTEIKALCLHVSHTCNLTCDYCFAAQGNFHGSRALMSPEVGRAAIDFLIAHSGKRVNLEVDFFGGEPLMNWSMVKETVAYARSVEKAAGKNFRFTLTTNGMLLDDEVMDFANREMHNVVLSLDGRKEVHDRLRTTASGKGSYDVIVPKFQEAVRRRGDREYYLRGTYTHFNTDFLQDILHMAELGFTKLSMEPVVCPPGDPYALTEEDLPKLYEQYEALALEMLRREREGSPFVFYHYMLDLTGGPCVYKRLSGCGAGTEYLAVTPWGELFPCHQFVGDPAYSMGNLRDGVTNETRTEEFRACNAYAKPACRECWARLYCSGGCAANAYHAEGSITGIHEYGCKLFKKRVECALMMQVARSLERVPAAD